MTIISNEAYATAIINAAADPYDSEAVLNLVKFTQAIGYMPFW